MRVIDIAIHGTESVTMFVEEGWLRKRIRAYRSDFKWWYNQSGKLVGIRKAARLTSLMRETRQLQEKIIKAR